MTSVDFFGAIGTDILEQNTADLLVGREIEFDSLVVDKKLK